MALLDGARGSEGTGSLDERALTLGLHPEGGMSTYLTGINPGSTNPGIRLGAQVSSGHFG